ncbi:MAG: hypothetical protein KGL46_04090 [Hyphomicrobiales bacterium]|nr:hypothetical protein [Hyphomicrobiales bacterium]
MSAESDALAAATAQVLALLQEIQKSNARVIHAADTGGADATVIHPVPAIDAWSDDLVLIVDIAATNATAHPTIQASNLPPIPYVWPSGAAVAAGDITGAVILKVQNGPAGYQAEIVAGGARAQAAAGQGGAASFPFLVWRGGIAASSGVAGIVQIQSWKYQVTFTDTTKNYAIVGGLITTATGPYFEGMGGWLSEVEQSARQKGVATFVTWGLSGGTPAASTSDFVFIAVPY